MVQTHVTYAMLGDFTLPWIRDRFSSWRYWTSTASSPAKLPKPTTAKEEKCLQCGKCDRLPHGLTGDTWLGTYLYVHIIIYIKLYYIKLHYSIFDYILLFAYAYVNINIYLCLYIFIYVCVCVSHTKEKLDLRPTEWHAPGWAGSTTWTVATDIITIQEYKMASILPKKHVPIPPT